MGCVGPAGAAPRRLAASLLALCAALPLGGAGVPAALAGPGPGRDVRSLVRDVRRLTLEVRGIRGLGTGVAGEARALRPEIEELERAEADLEADVREHEVVVDLSADVLFDFDESRIKPEAAAALEKLALVIRGRAAGRVRIVGHTDSKGSEDYNQRLSERRAAAVRDWLVEHASLPAELFTVEGMGERRPVAPNTHPDGSDDPEGRARNRRVTALIATAE